MRERAKTDDHAKQLVADRDRSLEVVAGKRLNYPFRRAAVPATASLQPLFHLTATPFALFSSPLMYAPDLSNRIRSRSGPSPQLFPSFLHSISRFFSSCRFERRRCGDVF